MRFKKALSILCITAVLGSAALTLGEGRTEAKSSADFTDLKDLDAATKAKFDAMISAGVFDGVSEGTFGMKEEMNRAQYAKVAALIFGLKVDDNLKTSSFSDVKSDDPANGYALPYIEALKSAGITDGYGEGTYNPAGNVSKEQLATFLVRGLGKDADAKAASGVNDNTVSDWAKGYVALALELKLLSNNSDGTFGGAGNATRDLLLTGAYEAKEQYVPPASPSPSITPTPYITPTPSPTPTATPTPSSGSDSSESPESPATPTPTPEPTVNPTPAPSETPGLPVPILSGYSLSTGTQSGTVTVTVYGQEAGSSLLISTGSSPFAAPHIGDTANDAGANTSYVSGSDVQGIVTYPSYIGLYEVDETGAILKFENIELNAPDDLIISSYGLTAGQTPDSYILGLDTPPAGAVDWQVRTSSTFMMTPPKEAIFGGQAVASGAEFIRSPEVQYIGLAAVDSSGKVIAFRTIMLDLSNSPEGPDGGYDPNNPGGGYDPNNPGGGFDPNNPGGGYDPNNPGGGDPIEP
jgi:hypothetical protein